MSMQNKYAETFEGVGPDGEPDGYVYQVDPGTRNITIVKSPRSKGGQVLKPGDRYYDAIAAQLNNTYDIGLNFGFRDAATGAPVSNYPPREGARSEMHAAPPGASKSLGQSEDDMLRGAEDEYVLVLAKKPDVQRMLMAKYGSVPQTMEDVGALRGRVKADTSVPVRDGQDPLINMLERAESGRTEFGNMANKDKSPADRSPGLD